MFTVKNLLKLIFRHLIIIIIITGITVFLIIFLSNQIIKISDTVMLNKNLENQLKMRTLLLSTIEKDTKVVAGNDVKIENAFLSSDNILNYINSLDVLAQKTNVTQTYHFETPANASISSPFPLSTIAYNNSVTTNMTGLINFLKEFEDLPYYTKINSINISSQDKLGIAGTSNISIQSTLYTKTAQ